MSFISSTRKPGSGARRRSAGRELIGKKRLAFILPHSRFKGRNRAARIEHHIPHTRSLVEYIGTVLVFKDVTGERNIPNGIAEIQKLESLGNLSRAWRTITNNILTSVIRNISLAKMKGNSMEEIREYLEEAERGLMRATGPHAAAGQLFQGRRRIPPEAGEHPADHRGHRGIFTARFQLHG